MSMIFCVTNRGDRHELDVARIEQTALDEMATISYVRRCE